MKRIHALRLVEALALALALTALGAASMARAESASGPVTFEIALMPSPLQEGGTETSVYGTFTATGAIDAEGTASGSTGWGDWDVRLFMGDGTIDLAIDEWTLTWRVVRGEGFHDGLTGGGAAVAVYGTAIDPWTGLSTWTVDWTLTGSVAPSDLPTPTLLSATPADRQIALAWSDESADADVQGYRVYRWTQTSAAWMLVADAGLSTSYVDVGLTNDTTYCYRVTAYGQGGESAASNEICATPSGPPQAGVGALQTGAYVKSGKGRHATTVFELTTTFTRGDEIVFLARVLDGEAGLPIAGAVVDLWIQGAETRSVTSDPSDADGYARATWQTQTPGRKKSGGTGTAPGSYAAWVTQVSASGYAWDGGGTTASFTLD